MDDFRLPGRSGSIDGRVITAAGVSAGSTWSLTLAGYEAGEDEARALQLVIEYDPQPYDSGLLAKADPTLASARGRFSREASRSLLAGSEQMQKDTHAAEVVGQLHPPAANRVVAARDVMRVYGEGETAA